jgi:hypothetical protein
MASAVVTGEGGKSGGEVEEGGQDRRGEDLWHCKTPSFSVVPRREKWVWWARGQNQALVRVSGLGSSMMNP